VRTITALSVAALAEAAAPYGIESFDSVLKPLWKGIRAHRGKVLAAFLKVRAPHVNICTRFDSFHSIHSIPSIHSIRSIRATRATHAYDSKMLNQLRANTASTARLVSVKLNTEIIVRPFLKAIGFIIPLMDAMYANYYTREVGPEFHFLGPQAPKLRVHKETANAVHTFPFHANCFIPTTSSLSCSRSCGFVPETAGNSPT
jgi:hypothetical protein